MAQQGWGEFIVHYDDNTYNHHIPCWVDLDEMRAEFPNGDKDAYWEPSAPVGLVGDENWEEVEFEGEMYPAVQNWDADGYEHMMERYHGNFIVVHIPKY